MALNTYICVDGFTHRWALRYDKESEEYARQLSIDSKIKSKRGGGGKEEEKEEGEDENDASTKSHVTPLSTAL